MEYLPTQPIVEFSTPVGMEKDPSMNVLLVWHTITINVSVFGQIWLKLVINSVSKRFFLFFLSF